MTIHLSSTVVTISWWYIALALVVSAYHGYRGYVLQQAFAHYQQAQWGANYTLSPLATLLARPVYDGLFYAVCSLAGFAALWLAWHLFNTVPSIHDIPGGTSALLVFLFALGLLGVSGQLSTVIQQGKFPT
jgi:hypothetical protein